MVGSDNSFSLADMTLHSASFEHIPAIARMHSALFERPWEENFFKNLFEQRTNVSCVATQYLPCQLVGFLIGSQAADEAEILSLGVPREYQGQGIATALLSEFTKRVKKRKARTIFLEVSTENSPALNFYRKSGFNIIGRRKKYYEQKKAPPLDALTLSLSLLDKD